MEELFDVDDDLEVWDQVVCAVRWLRASGQRPDLTFPAAVREALVDWLGEQAALHHQDEPFPAETP
jgi:hypothetical protein